MDHRDSCVYGINSTSRNHNENIQTLHIIDSVFGVSFFHYLVSGTRYCVPVDRAIKHGGASTSYRR